MAGKPRQNGRHERVHRTLKQETATPPAGSLPAQQQRFDEFRALYNHERPHVALGQRTPASLTNPRRGPIRSGSRVRATVAMSRSAGCAATARSNGPAMLIFVGEALIGEPVGVVETDAGDWLVRYADVELGYIHPQRHRLSPRPLHLSTDLWI